MYLSTIGIKLLSVVATALVTASCVGTKPAPAASPFPSPKVPSLVMHADVDFTERERGNIQKAADIWRDQTSGLADLKVVYDLDTASPSSLSEHAGAGHHLIFRSSSSDRDVIDIDCEASEGIGLPPGLCIPMVLAWVDPSGGIHNAWDRHVELHLIVDRHLWHEEFSNSRMVEITLHEMGHVFGLAHVPNPQATMYPSNVRSGQGAVCLRQPDLVQFCTVNVCDGYKMKPCE